MLLVGRKRVACCRSSLLPTYITIARPRPNNVPDIHQGPHVLDTLRFSCPNMISLYPMFICYLFLRTDVSYLVVTLPFMILVYSLISSLRFVPSGTCPVRYAVRFTWHHQCEILGHFATILPVILISVYVSHMKFGTWSKVSAAACGPFVCKST